MITKEEIVALLPYSSPFLFADELLEVNENSAKGCYTFREDEFFYKGHFKDFPVTPGVILTETMAQLGVVCLGIYLVLEKEHQGLPVLPEIALTSADIEFRYPVFPGEKVIVTSEKEYFRFGKLKCKVEMRNSQDKLVCSGTISGFIKRKK